MRPYIIIITTITTITTIIMHTTASRARQGRK